MFKTGREKKRKKKKKGERKGRVLVCLSSTPWYSICTRKKKEKKKEGGGEGKRGKEAGNHRGSFPKGRKKEGTKKARCENPKRPVIAPLCTSYHFSKKKKKKKKKKGDMKKRNGEGPATGS